MLKQREYPKTLNIGNEVYRVRFVRRFDDRSTLGECDPSEKEIRIRLGQSHNERFKTFLHEILHALEFELDLKITHRQIEQLEEPLAQFLSDNFL